MKQVLFDAAIAAMAKCHAPYSKFPVGAAILADDGQVYLGANIEVVAFPEGWCAETSAIAHKVMAGGKRIVEVAVVAEKLEMCSPCGGCRQRLAEFATAATVIHMGGPGGIAKSVRMDELLPFAFDTDSLE